jgi:hypothetical protein
MSLRVSIGLFAIALASSFFAPSTAQFQGANATWAACVAALNAACVLDEAVVVSRAMTTGGWRVYSLISVAEAQAEGRRKQEAAAASAEATAVLNAAREGTDARWRANALGSIAAAQAKAGLQAEASATIGQVLETVQSIKDVEAFVDFDLVSIARGQAEAGNFAEALRVAHSIKGERGRAEAIGSVARGRARAGDFAEALRLAEAIAQWEDGDVLKFIADEKMKVGLKTEAAGHLDAAARLAQSHRNLLDGNVKILLSIADSQAKARLTNDARDTFQLALQAAQSIEMSFNMAPPPIVERIEAIIEVAEAEARAGMSGEAAAAFDLARELVSAISQTHWKTLQPDDITAERVQWQAYSFAAIAAGQARAGLSKEANVTIEQAMPLALSSNERESLNLIGRRAQILYLIASAQANVGNFVAAVQIVSLIKRDEFRAEALKSVAEAGQVAEVLQLARSVEVERERALMLASIAAEPSNVSELARIVAIATDIKDAYWRAHTLGSVAQAQAKAGQLSEAGTTIDNVSRIAWSMEPGIGRDQALGQIVDQLCGVAKALN